MLCHKCEHNGKFVGVAWEETPCAKCQLRLGSSHTREYSEGIIDEEKFEEQKFEEAQDQSFDELVGNEDEPMIPLSVLGQAMACWVALPLPAREVFKMRMVNKSMSEIAKQLGICKTSVFNVLDQAIKENPVMASIANCKRFETRGSKTSNVR